MNHPSDDYPLSQVTSVAIRLLLFSWLVVALCVASALSKEGRSSVAKPVHDFVDPNKAPWWELTVLPGVGHAMARRIVSHRETILASKDFPKNGVVYRSVKDLDAVRGIGPKSLARLVPYLRLDRGSELSGSPRPADHNRQPQ